MHRLHSHASCRGGIVVAMILLAAAGGSLMPAIAAAENRVHIDAVHSGNPFDPVDTIYVGGDYQFRLWIENQIPVYVFVLTFRVSREGDVGMTYIPQPDGLEHGEEFTVAPGSRMDPPDDVFDLGGVYGYIEEFYGQQQSDAILLSGVSYHSDGLAPGPLEDMIRVHFRVSASYDPQVIGTICIDTTEYGCACDDNIFNSQIVPGFDTPRCWPVRMRCGDPNGDGNINIADVAFMIAYIFRNGPSPDPWQLGDANLDGTLNLGDALYLLYAAFRGGPQPECPENPPMKGD